MENKLQLVVHGRGNAWPVPLGETHPFYDRTDPRELSNSAFSLVLESGGQPVADILVDAGHGTIQSLVSGSNRIPDCICLTHGHMDHTVSVDWVVQSYWRLHNKQKLYPVYASAPVYEFLVQSYPHLEELVEFNELVPGITLPVAQPGHIRLTSYPVFHGKSAVGASMLLFETDDKRILFTGDLFSPLLRQEDYTHLNSIDMVVADSNNRFPWPRTNHWSFSGHPVDPLQRNESLTSYLETLGWEEVTGPHSMSVAGESTRAYFNGLKEEWSLSDQPFTVVEFLQKIEPLQVVLVHYSGMEDAKYHDEAILNSGQLLNWITRTAHDSGIGSRFIVPQTGEVIYI